MMTHVVSGHFAINYRTFITTELFQRIIDSQQSQVYKLQPLCLYPHTGLCLFV